MSPGALTELSTNCQERQAQCVTRQTRRRARGREAKQVVHSKIALPECVLFGDALMANYTLHFPTINETNEKENVDSVPPKNPSGRSATELRLTSPTTLLECPESCSEVIEKLDRCDRSEQRDLVQWMRQVLRKLALLKHGSRVVQKAFEVATGSDRDEIIQELANHIVELYESPHGNHVLSRAIETLPAAKTGFIISAFRGRGFVVSKHRYGCRVVCRLIEHAGADQINELMAELIEDIESLAKQSYGNFVVQSILEHATSWRPCVISRLLKIFPSLCMDRSGSLVAQRILDSCDDCVKNTAIDCLNMENMVEVACSRYGSYVVEQIASMQSCSLAARRSASILSNGIHELQRSEFAQRVIEAFQLFPNDPESGKTEGGESPLA